MRGEDTPAPEGMVPIELPSQLNRHQRRAKAARAARPNGRPRREPLFQMDDGDSYGYRILRPTKGWQRYSERRIDARNTTQAKLTGALPWWAGVPALMERAARG